MTKLAYFDSEWTDDLQRVNAVIVEQLRSDVVLIEQIGRHIISSGGKRMRPLMAVLSGKALGYQEHELYRQAAMVEFIHTSTLLHDDVVDESDKRRGKDTANHLFGNAPSVLVGDFLYTRAFQLMVGSGKMKLMQIMADATNVIASGEVMQLMHIGNIDLTEAQYFEVIHCKTAQLFEAAATIGAVLANAPQEQESALAHYGQQLGIAFQIVDDLLDYDGDTDIIGKNLGDDLAEGKITLPLIYLLQNSSENIIATVKNALLNDHRKALTQIQALLKQSDALDYCRQKAREAVQSAQNALSVLPQNHYTETLFHWAEQSINRAF